MIPAVEQIYCNPWRIKRLTHTDATSGLYCAVADVSAAPLNNEEMAGFPGNGALTLNQLDRSRRLVSGRMCHGCAPHFLFSTSRLISTSLPTHPWTSEGNVESGRITQYVYLIRRFGFRHTVCTCIKTQKSLISDKIEPLYFKCT